MVISIFIKNGDIQQNRTWNRVYKVYSNVMFLNVTTLKHVTLKLDKTDNFICDTFRFRLRCMEFNLIQKFKPIP